MSKARAIITAVTVEGISQSEAARRFGVSRSWVSKLMARYRTEGEAAFEPRSRRPRSSPNRVADVVNDLIVNLREQLTADGLDAGPHTIQWHLQADHGIDVSVSTIRRRLVAAGLVEPAPKKRPKSSYIRFEAALPNETWQSDFTHIYLADGTDTETITWLDDHSRYALHVSAHRRVTGNIVRDTFDETAQTHGFPASVLTDNGQEPEGFPFTPFGSPGSGAAGIRSRPDSPSWASTTNTLDPTTRPPLAKSNGSNRPSRNGWPPDHPPKHSPVFNAWSMSSSTSTTIDVLTPRLARSHQPSPIAGSPKTPPATTAPEITIGYVTTESTKPAPCHSAELVGCTTSAWVGRSKAHPSCSSSTTSKSES